MSRPLTAHRFSRYTSNATTSEEAQQAREPGWLCDAHALTLHLVELGKMGAVDGLITEHAVNGEVLDGLEAVLRQLVQLQRTKGPKGQGQVNTGHREPGTECLPGVGLQARAQSWPLEKPLPHAGYARYP